MIESASALARVAEIAAVDGVDQLFVGPYDLSLSLGTTVQALLDDDSEGNPLARIVETAAAYGRVVGGFAGTPDLVRRFRERGISCVAVATDLWITAEGARCGPSRGLESQLTELLYRRESGSTAASPHGLPATNDEDHQSWLSRSAGRKCGDRHWRSRCRTSASDHDRDPPIRSKR